MQRQGRGMLALHCKTSKSARKKRRPLGGLRADKELSEVAVQVFELPPCVFGDEHEDAEGVGVG